MTDKEKEYIDRKNDKCENPTLNKLLKKYDNCCFKEVHSLSVQIEFAGRKYKDLTKSEKRRFRKAEKRIEENQKKRNRIDAKIKAERYHMLGSDKDFMNDPKLFENAFVTAFEMLQLEGKRHNLRQMSSHQKTKIDEGYRKLIPEWIRLHDGYHPLSNMYILAETCELFENGVIPLFADDL